MDFIVCSICSPLKCLQTHPFLSVCHLKYVCAYTKYGQNTWTQCIFRFGHLVSWRPLSRWPTRPFLSFVDRYFWHRNQQDYFVICSFQFHFGISSNISSNQFNNSGLHVLVTLDEIMEIQWTSNFRMCAVMAPAIPHIMFWFCWYLNTKNHYLKHLILLASHKMRTAKCEWQFMCLKKFTCFFFIRRKMKKSEKETQENHKKKNSNTLWLFTGQYLDCKCQMNI